VRVRPSALHVAAMCSPQYLGEKEDDAWVYY